MIDRTPPLAAYPPTEPVERIELALYHGELCAYRIYRPAEGMDLEACIKAIVNPEHGVLDLFACSRHWPHRVGKRGKLGSAAQRYIEPSETMEIESAMAFFADGTDLEMSPRWFEIAAAALAAGVSWPE